MVGTATEDRVVATPAALEAIAELREQRGPVMFHQSGGCCDGSLPMCFDEGELIIGNGDVLLGYVGRCAFYIDSRVDEAWGRVRLVLDVSAGEPEGFSLAAGSGRHFVTGTDTQASCSV